MTSISSTISIIIRTFNEEKYLGQLLAAIRNQKCGPQVEIVLVDSGSTDRTLQVAEQFNVNIVHIQKKDFTFGRSLNMGCRAAKGDYLVFISGHCIPVHNEWLEQLVQPLIHNPSLSMTYGRQLGNEKTKFSEHQIFAKYFGDNDSIPQKGYFTNNANSAIRKSLWLELPFDEDLTGLEDMDWAKKMMGRGYSVGYVAIAPVFHIHEENWKKIKIRYEREAIALQKIMPEVHFTKRDLVRYFAAAVFSDMGKAISEKCLLRSIDSIISFRFGQYLGSYLGNREHRKLSQYAKEKYFYPV